MSNATEADIQALIAELKVLRADFAKITEIVKETARHGSEEAAERKVENRWFAYATVESPWSGSAFVSPLLAGRFLLLGGFTLQTSRSKAAS